MHISDTAKAVSLDLPEVKYRSPFRRIASEVFFALQNRSAFWRISDLILSTIACLLAFRFSPHSFLNVGSSPQANPGTVVPAFGLCFIIPGIAGGLYDSLGSTSLKLTLFRLFLTTATSW